MWHLRYGIVILASSVPVASSAWAQNSAGGLQEFLAREDPAELAEAALEHGDAKRGAILFYQPYMACTKCHTADATGSRLGPDLTKFDEPVTAVHLIDSVLKPSKTIRKGYQTVTVVDSDGLSISGLFVKESPTQLVLRDPNQNGRLLTLPKNAIEVRNDRAPSIMPEALVNQLASRQQFLDLSRYLIEIAEGGPSRARELQPPPSAYAARPLPEYENRIDHAGMIQSLDRESFRRGEAIYNRLCINCHGTHDRPGSLPTSLRFATGKFKNGSDPYTMYQTLTKGFGMMVPQLWMVPEQKYDVIHYVREAYLKEHNPAQYARIDDAYLARLPKGDTRGPKPSNILPWEQMDYGPNLVATYEIGRDGKNFAYKGNAIRLDYGPGGVSQGNAWMIFDRDTFRVAAAWSGKGFIDWNGINFNDRHGVHPRIVGDLQFENPTGPGWANPETGSFADPRLKGRDGRLYGPLPKNWAQFRGMFHHGNQIITSYAIGDTEVLERPQLKTVGEQPVFARTFNLGPRKRELVLQVARHPHESSRLEFVETEDHDSVAVFGPEVMAKTVADKPMAEVAFNGGTRVEIDEANDFDLTTSDYTITARLRTKGGGTIFAKTAPGDEWVPDGKALFVRGGRLVFDIGWVGAVSSRKRVNDGNWHDIAMTFHHKTGHVRLFIDGKLDGSGRLKPKRARKGQVVRIGFAAPDFPNPRSFFEGDLRDVRFYRSALDANDLNGELDAIHSDLFAHWEIKDEKTESVRDHSGKEHHGRVVRGEANTSPKKEHLLVAGLRGEADGLEWSNEDKNLRLKIPSGDEPIRFTLFLTRLEDRDRITPILESFSFKRPDEDLARLTKGGPPRWVGELKTDPIIGRDDGPFAVDVLTRPVNNPWFCRLRLTGFDFFPDGDRMAVCSWDGNVWIVSGLSKLRPSGLDSRIDLPITWRRITSGLFQPLGLKIVNEKIYVTCRDQICILHDLNDDGEIDFQENFNNDHQVTEHFHEFAMGLQTDDEGNFYYAKSARHALTALVPHHGTLLRVSPDGSRTEIVANGFRAANGVCVNPDGTFIVTDQEGHWNPKNRINWVHEGGFYGNMFGYHDVTDSSDDAMEQPLCWITNSFDRSPAELLWVESEKWGKLNGSLLNLSYGYGKVYLVPHEKVSGQTQGGMIELPIPQFPTGVMRGRFHPGDGQLYLCGMFAWAGTQHQPGGLYRLRRTHHPVDLPIELNANSTGVTLAFTNPLNRELAENPQNYSIKVWSLKRTANYGSKHYDERSLEVTSARLSRNGTRVRLEIPKLQPTWGMEIRYSLKAGDRPVEGVIHNTIHHMSESGSDRPSVKLPPGSDR